MAMPDAGAVYRLLLNQARRITINLFAKHSESRTEAAAI